MPTTQEFLSRAVEGRMEGSALEFLLAARSEITAGATAARFSELLSRSSRFAPRGPLRPGADELSAAAALLPDWSPEHWSCLDAVRVLLILSRPDLAEASGLQALEECFRFADEGESCALFRAIPLCPSPERFLWRVSDGCRTNMTSVFEAIACDSPYPVQYFDDVAWRQLVVKALFMGVPLTRVRGLDRRLDSELARIALDLADERRSAGRSVQMDLWLTLGAFGGERGLKSIEQELATGDTAGRCAAAIALSRAGEQERLRELCSGETDPQVLHVMERALVGETDQRAFAQIHTALLETNR